MQILTKQEKVRTNLESEEIKFELDTLHPEIMIKIVSDMYPNPRRTLMTEYVQNALDSHGEAGKSAVPIRVTLPTQLSPYYIVRDFGVGMTVDTLNDTFRYVFRSTKNTDPDQLGGFGIGKLVFGAYSGIMHVRLYSGTRMEEYIARLKDGFAGMQFVCGEDSKEEKGVEIRIPVLKDDVEFFHSQAKFLYSMLETRPIITNYPDFWKDFDATLKRLEFYRSPNRDVLLLKDIPKEHSSHSASPAQVLIGGLPFRLDWGILEQSVTKGNKEVPELINQFRKLPLYLYAGPSDVDIVPSRDNLKYNTKTCTWLVGKLRDIRKMVQQAISDKVRTAQTYKEVREFSSFIKREMPAFYALLGNTVWTNGLPFVSEMFNTIEEKCAACTKVGSYRYESNMFFSGNATRWGDKSCIDTSALTREDLITRTIVGPGKPETTESKNPKIRELVNYLLDTVEEVRGPKISTYGKVSQTDASSYKDCRRCLLPLAGMFDDFTGATDFNASGKSLVIFVYDLKVLTKADAYRRIAHLYFKKPADFSKGSSLLIGTNGVDLEGLLKKLNDEFKLGIKRDVFVDVARLAKPPAQPAGTRKSSATKGLSEFGANTIFQFDLQNGKSPKDNFNLSYWKPLDDAGLKVLEGDKTRDVLFLCVKSFKPDSEPTVFKTLHPDFDRGDRWTSCTTFLKSLKALYEGETGKPVTLVGVKSGVKLGPNHKRFLEELDRVIYDKLEVLKGMDITSRIPLKTLNAAIVLDSLRKAGDENRAYITGVENSWKFGKDTSDRFRELNTLIRTKLEQALLGTGVKGQDLKDLRTALRLMPFFFSTQINSSYDGYGANHRLTLAMNKGILRDDDRAFLENLGLGGLSKDLLGLMERAVEYGALSVGSGTRRHNPSCFYTAFLDSLWEQETSGNPKPTPTELTRKELDRACGACATEVNKATLGFLGAVAEELENRATDLGVFSEEKLRYFKALKKEVTGLNTTTLRSLQYLWLAKYVYWMSEDLKNADSPHFSALLFGAMVSLAFTQFCRGSQVPAPSAGASQYEAIENYLNRSSVSEVWISSMNGSFIRNDSIFSMLVEARNVLEAIADHPHLRTIDENLAAIVAAEFKQRD